MRGRQSVFAVMWLVLVFGLSGIVPLDHDEAREWCRAEQGAVIGPVCLSIDGDEDDL